MKLIPSALAGLALLALGACSGTWKTDYSEALSPAVTKGWRVSNVQVVIPDDLTTSDQNSYAPNFDIVWHGEAAGDRRSQVKRLLEEGVTEGAKGLRGRKPVTLQLVLAQFHAVTPIAVQRAPEAVHDIRYTMTVFDSAGNRLTEPEFISADLPAFVGQQAFVSAQQGQTQRVRIREHLAKVTAGYLGIGPDPRVTFQSIGR
ncbi:MAG: hypothetical protein OXC60_17580 [Litoreibacter sp.]|nr:hypothetical protein [Litoreibacter sp.]